MADAQRGVDKDVDILTAELQRFGGKVTFGVLCRDERCSDMLEALGGTLKAAKKRKLVAYDSELLLQGAHDNVEIRLVGDQPVTAAPTAAAPAEPPMPDTAAPADVAPSADHQQRQPAEAQPPPPAVETQANNDESAP